MTSMRRHYHEIWTVPGGNTTDVTTVREVMSIKHPGFDSTNPETITARELIAAFRAMRKVSLFPCGDFWHYQKIKKTMFRH